MSLARSFSQQCRLIFCVAAVFLGAGSTAFAAATDYTQAESYSGQSGVTTETCLDVGGGQDVTDINAGDYIYFSNMDFGASGIQSFEARIASYGNGGFIELHLDSQTGTLVGTCEILPPTGSWQTWTNKACNVTGATGVHTLYLVFVGGVGNRRIPNLFSVNWFKFWGTPTFTTANWRSTTNAAKGVWNTPITLSSTGGTPVITVTPGTQYQRVDGWGGAFNETGYHCIRDISASARTVVMQALYDPLNVNGCRFNNGRVPIGMSDFTVNQVYSLDESAGDYALNNFSLHNDSLMNIAFVKAAQAVNPNVMIYGSPWTPPQWMKSSGTWGGCGTINQNAQTWTSYAMYFRKFVQGWRKAGIPVNIVYPQNEPTWCAGGHPSCSWSTTSASNTLMNWVRDYLGPNFVADTLGTERNATQVWCGTWNISDYNNNIAPFLNDATCRTMITGIGVQRDGNNAQNSASQNTYYQSLHYHAMETETNCWSGANSWTDAMNTFQQIYNHEIANTGCYNMWNMILDANYNYVTWMGRSQNSQVTVTFPSQAVTYNPEFYIMMHWSRYVKPGAVRIDVANTNTGALRAAAFKNPDGTIILEIQNYSGATVSPLIRVGTQYFTPALVTSSVNTFNIGGTEPAVNWNPAQPTPESAVQFTPAKMTLTAVVTGPLRVYDIRGRLVKVFDRSSAKVSAGGILWDRTDAGGRRAAPGLYIIMDRAANAVVQKVMCQ
jgi:glucosylceramidase